MCVDKKEQYWQMVSFWERWDFSVNQEQFNGLLAWGSQSRRPWWDVMLLARLLLGPWSLCLIPMRSAFKLLLSEVPEMGGGGCRTFTQSSFANVFKGAALCSARRGASRCNHHFCVALRACLMVAGVCYLSKTICSLGLLLTAPW